ncbi:uncharacterized protein F5147DRAFT_584685 [Suillus discolor]|uniref:Uncharacterized protein n=1 Tax=Suillus discolor TaxID=1912936 RepID=A0A9P7EYE2_9AGAM|nr:uncharacterized protein F5147DRAFT_584685 [Suillus discolor]KAG2095116.1 hypothetical protein F5147DRAFT_584685 [Suillus discolor]
MQDLPCSEVASILQIELSRVEKWAIDRWYVLLTSFGLLSGKLTQTTQSLHVYRSSARTFERELWKSVLLCGRRA